MSTLDTITVRGSDTDRGRLQYVTLDSIQIGIRSRWSAYQEKWFLSFVAADGPQIAGPVAMVPAIDLWGQLHHDVRIPPGPLFVESTSRDVPDLDTIDVSARLAYRAG